MYLHVFVYGGTTIAVRTRIKKLLITVVLLYVFILSPPTSLNRWQQLVERGYLNWGTRASLLTYFETSEKTTGIEYILLKKLCDEFDIELKVHVFSNNTDMFSALQSRQVDLVGGYLSVTSQRAKQYQFTQPIDQSRMQLVVHSSLRKIDDIELLKEKKGEILSPSSYSEFFQNLGNTHEWNVELNTSASLYEIAQKVNDKEIDFTFADSKIITIYRRFFPRIRAIIDLTDPTDIAFMTLPRTDNSVLIEVNNIINNASKDGILEQLYTDIELSLPSVTPTDTVTFIDHYNRLWPSIRDLVYQTAEKYQFDPMLLGAISYQESHWKPDAVSFTGVEGLMMLTRRAANELNVSDRTDPQESLDGGVRYFLDLKQRLPERIQEPDRTYFALVAYNIGFGNMEQARVLTQQGGKNPDLWEEVNDFLPFLNDRKLKKQLKWGNADGKTAVDYVNNIITFKNLLQWKEQKTQTVGP